MKCRYCNSTNTRVTVTEPHGNETWRYCRCLDCDEKFKTIEIYAKPKPGPAPGKPVHPNTIKRGENNHNAVLNESNVKLIRELASQRQTYKEIADKFGVHYDTIYRIVNRKLWSHV